MEIQLITLILAVIAVVLGVIILSKVNKLTTMLRTPIIKKLSPDMNLKPSSRHAVSAQEMASRGDRNNKDNRNNSSSKDRNNKDNNRPDRSNVNARNVNDRRDRRQNNRNDRLPRTETTPVQENIPAFSSAEQPSQVQNQPRQPQPQPQVEARRPLTPRIQVEVPVAPVVSAPIAAPVSAETAVNDFDPSKVRYGRRNVVKKLPELADED